MITLFLLAIAGPPSVEVLLDAGSYREAVALAKEEHQRAEKEHGASSIEALDALDAWIEARLAISEYSDALEEAARDVIQRREKLHGEDVRLARSLYNLSLLCSKRGKHDAALEAGRRAHQLRVRLLGDRAVLTARALARIASILFDTSNLAEAKKSAESAQQVLQGTLYGDALRPLGAIAFIEGKMQDSVSFYRAELRLVERRYNKRHPRAADVLTNLGMTLGQLGKEDESIEVLTKSVEIHEAAKGPCPDMIFPLNSLALRAKARGDYAGALEQWERALAIADAKLGADHPGTAGLLNNLGNLMALMGDYYGALAQLRRALEIREKKLGPESLEVASTLTNIADVHQTLGTFEEGRTNAARALKIREKRYGKDVPLLSRSTKQLAELELELGRTAEALGLLERTVAIRSEQQGADHPELAEALRSLGLAQLKAGRREPAEVSIRKAIDIYQRVRGKEHPALAAWHADLSRILLEGGRSGEALEQALLAENIGRAHLLLVTRSFAEEESLAYAEARGTGLDIALQIAADSSDPAIVRRVWESLARARTLVLDELIARRRRSAETNARRGPTEVKFERASQTLAQLLVRGPGKEGEEAHKKAIEKARDERRSAERTLARINNRSGGSNIEPSFAELVAALPKDTALVAYARQRSGPSPEYFAFVLPDAGAEVIVGRLGGALAIERSVDAYQRAARSGAGGEAAFREAGTRLRTLIWDPIAPLLSTRRAVYVAPAGALYTVNLETLPDGQAAYLIESSLEMKTLASERDLLRALPAKGKSKKLLAVGAPLFGKRSKPEAVAIQLRCAVPDLDRFAPLPGAARELEEIAARWKATGATAEIWVGEAATEEAVKRGARGYRTLHFATHGFFLGSSCAEETPGTRGVGGLAPADRAPEPAGKLKPHPLRVSGLALTRGGGEDGILTAEEIAAIELDGTELAVLSACDTGAGEVVTGEGVLGLQRAFLVAGAGAVVMSSWPVEDESARAWMSAFYARYLEGVQISSATRGASLEILAARRKRGESTHPFWWGSFISTGAVAHAR